MIELDFKLYRGKTQSKSFTFRNEDGTFMDLSDSTINLDIYKLGTTELIVGIPGNISTVTGTVSFLFDSNILNWYGANEYIINKVLPPDPDVILVKGNLILEEYIPFSTTIDSYLTSELPLGFTPSVDFINQKTRYWRLYLQSAFDISDSQLNNDTAWPELVNALVAKLIAHDVLITSIRGNLITAFGEGIITIETSPAMGNDVKSIETGPSKVEFHPVGETLMQLLKSTTTGNSLLTFLAEDICGLASKIAIKLPMCKAGNMVIPFQIGRRTILECIDKVVSRG